MNEPCRVGMIIGRFAPREGGAETQCRHLSAQLTGKGHPVFVLTQRLPGIPSFELIQNIPVHRIGLPLNGMAGSFSFVAAGAFWLLRHRKLFDILHVHMASSPAFLSVLIGRLVSSPVLVKFACSREPGDIALSNKTWYGRIKLKVILRLALCVCPSREIHDELRGAGVPEQNIFIIPNGVDTGRFCPSPPEAKRSLRASLGIPDTALITVYSGRFEKGKGVETLIDAWKDAAGASLRKDLFLVLIGSGRLEPSLKDAARGDPRIKFTGWKSDPERYLGAGDIFVLPSFGEGMPNTLLEAMACGCASIATRIGGVMEIIEDGSNGLLFEPGDRAGLCALLASLIAAPERITVLGENGRRRACADFSLPSVTEKYRHLYAEILANDGPRPQK